MLVTAESLAAYTELVGSSALYPALALNDAVEPVLESLASPAERERVVHYAHELVAHRPAAPGDRLESVVTGTTEEERAGGRLVSVETETHAAGALVAEQVLTLFFRGTSRHAAPTRHVPAVPAGARIVTTAVAEDLPERYAEVSGDRFAIHLDDEFARSVGLPGRVVHGLCTLALAVSAVGGEVRRVGARFAAPVLPGSTLETAMWDDGELVRFECSAAGTRVLRDGVVTRP